MYICSNSLTRRMTFHQSSTFLHTRRLNQTVHVSSAQYLSLVNVAHVHSLLRVFAVRLFSKKKYKKISQLKQNQKRIEKEMAEKKSPKSNSGFTKEEELLLNDFSRNVSTKSSALFYGNAFIVSAIPICKYKSKCFLFHRSNQQQQLQKKRKQNCEKVMSTRQQHPISTIHFRNFVFLSQSISN